VEDNSEKVSKYGYGEDQLSKGDYYRLIYLYDCKVNHIGITLCQTESMKL
jgi:hypothetical protein